MTIHEEVDTTTGGGRPGSRRRPRTKTVVTGTLVVAVGVAAGLTVDRLHGGGGSGTASTAAKSTSTATATRRTLSSQTTVDGTLGYADTYTVVNELGATSNTSSNDGGSSDTSLAMQLTAADTPSPSPSPTPTPSPTQTPTPTPTPTRTPTPTPTPTTNPTPTPTRTTSPTPTPTSPAKSIKPTSPSSHVPAPHRTAPNAPQRQSGQQAPPETRQSSTTAPNGSRQDNSGPGANTTSSNPSGQSSGTDSGNSGQSSAGSGQSSGIATGLPEAGQVVDQGQALYSVNGTPVVLLYGSTPAYRSLDEGKTGADVTELNKDLVALGYATTAQLSPTSDTFSAATKTALEKLQKHVGVSQTGTLDLGQAVFLPTAARITTVQATLGAPLTAGATVLQATSTTREVAVDLDTSEESDVKVGDDVTITLPNNQTTSGRVADVGTVATAPGSDSGSGSSGSGSSDSGSGSGDSSGSGSSSDSATVEVDVTPVHPDATGTWDQAPVQVNITTGQATDALVVPVDALQAQAGGGYAVQVVNSDSTPHLVPVSLGLFDDADGLVQVTNTQLQPGQRVVVPAR